MKRKTVFILILFLVIVISGCKDLATTDGDLTTTSEKKEEIRIEDYIYDCSYSGDYYFPADEPIFKEIDLSFTEWDELKDDECMLFLEYKIKVEPTDNPYYEVDWDLCRLTMSQLASFKEEKASLLTMVKDASCEENTNFFLPSVSEDSDFKIQLKKILGDFAISSTEFSEIYVDYSGGSFSEIDFKEALNKEKTSAVWSLDKLKALQPKPEEEEMQTVTVTSITHYIEALNSLEEYMDTQSEEAANSYMAEMTQAEEEMAKLSLE